AVDALGDVFEADRKASRGQLRHWKKELWVMKIRHFAVIAVAGAMMASRASAASALLSDLLDGGTITQGDKVFSNFRYTASGDMPAADHITITGIGTGVGTDYFGIEITGAFHDLEGDGASDASIF